MIINSQDDPSTYEVRVPIDLDISKDLFSIKFEVSYDQNVVTATAVNSTSERLTANFIPEIDDVNGKVVISLLDLFGGTVVKQGTGQIMDIIFSVDQPEAGSYPLNLMNIRDVSSTDGLSLQLSAQNGEINLLQQVCNADVDKSCELDVFDIVYINRYNQGFTDICPPAWRSLRNPPPEEEMRSDLDNCINWIDIDGIEGVDVFDLVIIARTIQNFTTVVPSPWRLIKNFSSDEEIKPLVEALKPTCTNAQSLNRTRPLRRERVESYSIQDTNNLIYVESANAYPGSTINIPINLNIDKELRNNKLDN